MINEQRYCVNCHGMGIDCPFLKEPAPKEESDWQQRFRERFRGYNFNAPTRLNILAFIDEETREAHFRGNIDGRKAERASLIEKIEGIEANVSHLLRARSEGKVCNCLHDVKADLDDLLTSLRGDNQTEV